VHSVGDVIMMRTNEVVAVRAEKETRVFDLAASDNLDALSAKDSLPLEKVDWSLADSFAVAWNDGHVPESLIHSAPKSQQQWMRVYPKYHGMPNCCLDASPDHQDASSLPFVYCCDDAAPEDLADTVYRATTKRKTWGSYVTMKQIRQYWDNYYSRHSDYASCDSGHPSEEDSIALPSAAWFIRNFMQASKDHSTPNHFSNQLEHRIESASIDIQRDQDFRSILHEAHGVAVWALSSNIGSHVPYHLDYAELLRYETGVIVPPVLAGTWHCSRRHLSSFSGGDYCVVVRGNGLDHYNRHGYKESLEPMTDDEGCHIQFNYMFNRMICQSGHLPHWSTLVEAPIPASNDSTMHADCDSETDKRVVVGFNVFLHDVGPVIQPAPEHSEAFRKRVRLPRRSTKSDSFSLEAVMANPRLRRLLILAKREKRTADLVSLKHKMEVAIQKYLESKQFVSVKELLELFPSQVKNDDPFNIDDMHVCIHNLWKGGGLQVVGERQCVETTKLISKEWHVALTKLT
jgi:hypothetical protein